MRPGAVVAGRFRVVRALDARQDRRMYVAVDEVTRQVVTVQAGGRALAEEADVLMACAGRGVVRVLGIWRDGRDVLLVSRRREPVVRAVDCGPTSPDRALAWLADVAAGLERLHRAGHVHGDLSLERIVVVGGVARIDLTGPWEPDARAAHDTRVLATLLQSALDSRQLRWRDRGCRSLMSQLAQPGITGELGRAGAVRVAAERVLRRRSRRPGRLQSVAWVPRSSAVVLARPDGTCEWTAASAPLSIRRARHAAATWRAQGMTTQVVRRGLSIGDVLWMVVGAAMCGVLLPVVGLVLGGFVVARWRASRCQPGVGRDLPVLPLHPPPTASL